MPCSWLRHLALLALACTFACNQADPPGSEGETGEDTNQDTETGTDTGETGETGTDTDGEDFSATLYPMAHLATWTYVEKNLVGQVLGMEEVEMRQASFEGGPAFLQVDSPNNSGEWTESLLVRDGTVVMRVHKDIIGANGPVQIVDYDPGFSRSNDAWTMVGQSEEFLYVRTEYDGAGQNPIVEDRGHLFTVLAVDEEVTVPAGTFDCVKVERIRTVGGAAGERVLFWFAWGVGKVREERPAESVVEELASVSIPGWLELP